MSIGGFIQTLLFAALFLIFINGGTGRLLVYTLLIAGALSFTVCFLSRKRFTVEIPEFSGMVRADGECELRITFAKNGLCFLPFITAEGVFAGQKFAVKTSLLFKRSVTLPIKLKAPECGLQKAKITRTVTEDFMGLFRFKRQWELSTSAAVLPRIVDYQGPEIIPSLLPSEDEDREEGATVMFGGTAGYEHRPYTDGDSPRRINYKLSAKKKQLMVRLDESAGTESTNIILAADADGDCAEQAYALARRLVMRGSPAAVYHRGERFSAVGLTSLVKLREWLAFREFGADGEAFRAPDGSVNVVISPQGIRTSVG